ncbi:hypothetical protein L6R49_31215, partial [Myxococcota bacterium]|nr:hypothetical protein [Myxococcota bacterium]
VIAGVDLFTPLDGVIDLVAERARLDKEIARVEKDKGDLEKRLNNPGFMERAPADVVVGFREKLALADQRLTQLRASRASLG